MRHGKKFNHLGRKSAHRKAMLSNMSISLIEHKRIKTTVAKAKALKVFVEPIINRAKEDSTHSRRMVFKKLQSKEAVKELFSEISEKIGDRKGGYTRILKTGARLGDNAEMCIIELVDYNEEYTLDKKAKTTHKKTRRRGGKTPKVEDTKVVDEVKEEVKEVVKDDVVDEVKEVATDEEVVENDDKKEEDKKEE